MSDHVLIMGAGISGYGAARYLRDQGKQVSVSEAGRLSPERLAEFSEIGVEVRDGGHDLAHLDGIDYLVCSPGVPPSLPILAAARGRGLEIQSELDVVLQSYTGRIIGVTGTNGKSTTVSMISHILTRAGVTHSLAGNIGAPPTLLAAEGKLCDTIVLELSSYQLASSQPIAADVAVWTSFSPDHLAYHGSLEEYFRAKRRLFEGLKRAGRAILHATVQLFDPSFYSGLGQFDKWLVDGLEAGVQATSATGAPPLNFHLPSLYAHDQQNAVFASLACEALTKTPATELAMLLTDFSTLPHRCERVAVRTKSIVINDSKATNVDSTIVALQAVSGPLILMLGGAGKGESFLPILEMRDKIEEVVAFGAEGERIAAQLAGQVKMSRFPTLAQAIPYGFVAANKIGVTLLLSPGCASFDEFRNFEHRGEFFKEKILELDR